MYIAQIWDGTKQRFDDLDAAIHWAKHQIKSWMEPGDAIDVWRDGNKTYLQVLDGLSNRTDAGARIKPEGVEQATD